MGQRALWMVCVILVIGLFSSAALAGDLLGPPTPGTTQGQWLWGLEYSRSNMDLEVSGPVSPLNDAVINLDSNKYFARIGYGISDDCEIYALLGMADGAFDGDSTGPDFDGDAGFAYGLGIKKTIAQNDSWTWGAVFQATWGEVDDTMTAPVGGATIGSGAISLAAGSHKVTLDWYEFMLAFGPTVVMSEEVSVYGGPYINLFNGDLEIRGSQDEYELEQRLELGGFLGILFNLGQGLSVNVEGQAGMDSWLGGIGVQLRQ